MSTISRRRVLPLFLAAAAFAAVAGTAAPAARAQEEPKEAATALVMREYPAFKFKMEIPKIWQETVVEKGVKWLSGAAGQAATCEITYWSDRRDLEQIEKNLRGTAEAKSWTFVDPPKRMKVDDNPAFHMLVDIPSDEPIRQVFIVIDAPQATYLITYGDLASEFNRELIDRVVGSFRRHEGGDASGTVSGGQATAGDNWGCVVCQKAWATNVKFCGDCGAKNGPLAPEKKKFGCATCKKEWPESQKFCGECGASTGPFPDKEK